MEIRFFGAAAGAVILFVGTAGAAVRLGAPFRDGMVLQREMPVNVWGTAAAGERVTVSFAGKRATAKADASGRWRVALPPLLASKEPRRLTAGEATVSDVLVGEVWIAAGQSNMVVPLESDTNRFRDQIGSLMAESTRRPLVRFMATPYETSGKERSAWPKDVAWTALVPENAAARTDFSAIGWHFAVGLYDTLDVPVGIVFNAWNGSRIEGWIPPEGYAAAGLDVTSDVYDAGGYGKPSSIWNGKVAPLAPMTVRGFLWYQGESNCSAGYGPKKLGGYNQYTRLLKALYAGWRVRFGNPDLKMVVSQLAYWGNGNEWLFQEAQDAFAASEPNAEIAVINDVGIIGDIHGSDKFVTARRMLALALEHHYGLNVRADPPRIREAVAEGPAVTLSFDHARKLRLWSDQELELNSRFQLAGADGVFYDARIENFQCYTNARGEPRMTKGNIQGNTIRLAADRVADPKQARYLHMNRLGNIFNEMSLPLAAFSVPVKGKGKKE